MVKKLAQGILILLFISVGTLAVNATDLTSINELVDNSLAMDQETIRIQAETIGEVLERDEYSWINVNDGTNAIGIWLPSNEALKIKNFGSYFMKGDTLEIIGVFNRTCEEHGGEMDIHTQSITVIKSGSEIEHPISILKFSFAIILLTAALFMAYMNRRFFIKKKTDSTSINE
jgi:hypothetical protein